MPKIVWTKFYWQDWLSDAGLRRSSVKARGLWMDMLCIAAQHDPIGLVAVNGEGLTVDDIARVAGIDPREAATLIGELERNDVFARDRKGSIYSRRMIRDAKKAALARKNGNSGGNPNLGNKRGNSASDNPPDKPPDKTQELRAKSQKSTAPPEQVPRSKTDLDALEAALRGAAGLEDNPSPGLLVLGPIIGLIDAGYSLEVDILPIIKASRRKAVRSWSYFVPAITEARAKRAGIASQKAPEVAVPSAADLDKAAFFAMDRAAHDNGGPLPDYVARKYGADVVKRWKAAKNWAAS